MIQIFSPLREAYITKLASLSYLGVNIPVDDENLTQPKAELPVGNSTGVQAWVLLTDQTLQDNSSKCCVNQNTQLTIDVYTEFMAATGSNSGNYTHSDKIAGQILAILFPNCSNIVDISMPEAQIWLGYLETSLHIMEEYSSSRLYRTVLILNHSVKQN